MPFPNAVSLTCHQLQTSLGSDAWFTYFSILLHSKPTQYETWPCSKLFEQFVVPLNSTSLFLLCGKVSCLSSDSSNPNQLSDPELPHFPCWFVVFAFTLNCFVPAVRQPAFSFRPFVRIFAKGIFSGWEVFTCFWVFTFWDFQHLRVFSCSTRAVTFTFRLRKFVW